MIASVLEGTQQIDVVERSDPVPGPGEALIRVRARGICGTDQHIYHGLPGSATAVLPRILGHEFAREIVALGERIYGASLAVGDRVTVVRTFSVGCVLTAIVDACISATICRRLA